MPATDTPRTPLEPPMLQLVALDDLIAGMSITQLAIAARDSLLTAIHGFIVRRRPSVQLLAGVPVMIHARAS